MTEPSINPFAELQKYVSTLKTSEQIDDKCNKLTEIETRIENTSNDYTDKLTQTLYDTRQNLADKKTSIEIFKKETKNLKDHISNIKQEKENKRRVVESEWEYDRYTAHIYILKLYF